MGRKKKGDIYPDINDEFAEFETEEEKKEKKKQKKAEEDDVDCLPKEGLYTPDGHLFYHENPYQLTAPQYKRAAEHGINLRKKIGFSIEESVQMFKNWKKFAEENKIKLEKAEEYVGAKKAQKHLLQHQEEFKFWPKLCNGLPHRAGYHVKQRAEFMLTEDFLKTLDWSNLEEEIRLKFYVYTDYSEEQMQKAKKLLDRGYVAGHVGELLGVSKQIASGMQKKLKAIDERDDPQMVQQFFEAAVTFGLDFDKLREYLESGDDVSYHYLDKDMKIKEMSLKIHMSTDRIREFLKTWLRKIWEKYQEKKENDKRTAEEKYEEAMKVISSKPPLSNSQIIRGLEIFCQNVKPDEKSIDLVSRKDIAKLLRKAGVTDFMCHMPEYQYLYQKFCSHMPQTLERWLFRHLRRSFRFQVKLHILLWTWKTSEWNKLKIGPNETRYEAVLRHEKANPYVSKMTLKFLKDKDVAEWIMEPRLHGAGRGGAIRRRQLGIELFVLYCNQKYGSRFLFPAKLRPLLSKSAKQIRKILEKNEKESEGDQDSEYVSIKEVREVVEKATNTKLVTGVSKWVMEKEQMDSEESDGLDEDSDDDRENSENPEDLKRLLNHIKADENDWVQQKEADIQEVLDRADPSKRKKGFKDVVDADDESGAVELTEEVRRERQALRRVEERWKKRYENKQFKSRDFIEDSETSSDGGSEGQKDSGVVEAQDSESQGDSDDVEVQNSEGQGDSDGVGAEDSEDQGDSHDVGAQGSEGEVVSGASEVKKKTKKKKRDSQDPEGQKNSGVVGAQDSEDQGDPEDVGAQDSEGQLDSEASKVKKKSKKRKRDSQDSEGQQDSGIVETQNSEGRGDPDDVGAQDSEGEADSGASKVKKKSKKRKRDSEDIQENSESPDVEKKLRKKAKKSKEQDSGVHEEPEDVKKSKKSKKRLLEDSEGLENSESPRKAKKLKKRDAEVLEQLEGSESPKKRKKLEKKKPKASERF